MSNNYVAGGGLIVALGATTVEQTGMLPGWLYEFTTMGGHALMRWGASDASAADAGFDFAVSPGGVVRAVCPTNITAINIIEADAQSVATAQVAIARLYPI